MAKDNFNENLEMYERFSERRKLGMLAIVAFCGFLGPFASGSFLPAIPQMSEALGTSKTILNVTVSIYILVAGSTPLIWAPYGRIYGKRPIYLLSLSVYVLGCIGVALSKDLWSLILTRIIQAVGSSAVLSIGAGTIGDLYIRERRGRAMGLFYQGVLIGPAFAPVIAGILTQYSPVQDNSSYIVGWRNVQWLQAGGGLLALALVYVFLPETSHCRGIDLIREQRRRHREELAKGNTDQDMTVGRQKGEGGYSKCCNPSKKASDGVPLDDPEEPTESAPVTDANAGIEKKIKEDRFILVWINPLASLSLLKRPHIVCMSLNSAFVLVGLYSLIVPITSTIAPRYGITNIAIIGLFYLAQGFGTLMVASFIGRYADYTLKKWLRKRNGEYVPEDRLRASLASSAFLMPGGTLILGWIMEKVEDKRIGIPLCVIFLVITGGAQISILTPTNTYCVDVMHSRSSEVIAVNNCVRYAFSAAATAYILPLIDHIGVGWANTITAFLNLLGFAMICICLKWGKQLRAFGRTEEDEGHEAVVPVQLEKEELPNLEERITRTSTFDGAAGFTAYVGGNDVQVYQSQLERQLTNRSTGSATRNAPEGNSSIAIKQQSQAQNSTHEETSIRNTIVVDDDNENEPRMERVLSHTHEIL